jgi:hypothetical protein
MIIWIEISLEGLGKPVEFIVAFEEQHDKTLFLEVSMAVIGWKRERRKGLGKQSATYSFSAGFSCKWKRGRGKERRAQIPTIWTNTKAKARWWVDRMVLVCGMACWCPVLLVKFTCRFK